MFAPQHVARDFANLIEAIQRNDFLVRGDLENRISRGVDDWLLRLYVFVAELLDDFGAARRNVAEHARHMRSLNEVVDERLRKSIRIRGKRALENDPGHLPMTRCRIFAVRAERALAVGAARVGNRRNTGERPNVSQPEALQIRQIQLSRFADMAKR